MSTELQKFISAIRALQIPRIEDLPYSSSRAAQFVYESSATVAAGQYTWTDTPSVFTPVRPINVNTLYFFRSITLVADISSEDFPPAIDVTPSFRLFRRSTLETPSLREPILFPAFLYNFDYRFTLVPTQNTDELLGAFVGTLDQTAALVGKNTITLKAILAAQEIKDQAFIDLFLEGYPKKP